MKTIPMMKQILLLLALTLFTQGALLAQPSNRPSRGEAPERSEMANRENARAMMLIRLAQMDDEQLEHLHKAVGELRQMSPRERQQFAERTRARMSQGRGPEDAKPGPDDARRGPPPAVRGMPDEERQQLRDRVRDMTPEEREELRNELREGAQERRPEEPRPRGRSRD
jgi:hypothetical protein